MIWRVLAALSLGKKPTLPLPAVGVGFSLWPPSPAPPFPSLTTLLGCERTQPCGQELFVCPTLCWQGWRWNPQSQRSRCFHFKPEGGELWSAVAPYCLSCGNSDKKNGDLPLWGSSLRGWPLTENVWGSRLPAGLQAEGETRPIEGPWLKLC